MRTLFTSLSVFLLLLAPIFQLRSMAPASCELSSAQTIAETKGCCAQTIENTPNAQTAPVTFAQMVARSNCCQRSTCCASNPPLDTLPTAVVNTQQANAPPFSVEALPEEPSPSFQASTRALVYSTETPISTVRFRLCRMQSWRI